MTTLFDEMVVQRLTLGEDVIGYIHPADKQEVVRRMTLAGFSMGQIAFRLHITCRTVSYYRTKLKITPPKGVRQDGPRIPRKMHKARLSEIFK